MQIPPQKIQEFKSLCKKHFGEALSDKEALVQVRALLVFIELGFKPIE